MTQELPPVGEKADMDSKRIFGQVEIPPLAVVAGLVSATPITFLLYALTFRVAKTCGNGGGM